MAFWDEINKAFLGSPAQTNTYDKYKPEQMQRQNAISEFATNNILGSNLDPQARAARIQKKYETQTIPSLLARFQSSQGQGNPFSNSAIGGQLAQSGVDLGEALNADESQFNLNKIQALNSLFNTSTPSQFDTERIGAEPGFLQQFGSAFAQQLPKYLLGTGQQTQSSTGFGSQGGGVGGITPENIQTLIKLAAMFGL